MKVVIHPDFGGFTIRRPTLRRMAELGSEWAEAELVKFDEYARTGYAGISEGSMPPVEELPRHDPILVRAIEEQGEEGLVIIEIPDGVKYEIVDYDGAEHIAETHRKWGVGYFEGDDET